MELVFLVPVAFLAALTFIVKWTLEHSRWKRQYQAESSSSDNTLGKSELKALIRQAVEEATAPLADRIATLEQGTEREALPHPDLLDVAEGYVAEAAPNAPRRQPVR